MNNVKCFFVGMRAGIRMNIGTAQELLKLVNAIEEPVQEFVTNMQKLAEDVSNDVDERVMNECGEEDKDGSVPTSEGD